MIVRRSKVSPSEAIPTIPRVGILPICARYSDSMRAWRRGLPGGNWNKIIGIKNTRGHYFRGGRAANESDEGFKTTYLGIRIRPSDDPGAAVTRVEFKLKDLQTNVQCEISGIKTPMTKAACFKFGGTPVVDNKYDPDGEGKLYDSESSRLNNFVYAAILGGVENGYTSFNIPSPYAHPQEELVGRGEWKDNDDILSRGSTIVDFEPRCLDKSDGCDAHTIYFTDGFIDDAEWLYIWYPNGYMHLWSVDIYAAPSASLGH